MRNPEYNNNTPLVTMIQKHFEGCHVSFSMPGHKSGMGFDGSIFEATGKYDASEVFSSPFSEDTYDALHKAEALAAEAFGAKDTIFSCGGSSVPIVSAIFALSRENKNWLIERSCHKSIYEGMAMSGVEPHYIYPKLDEENFIIQKISPEEVKAELKDGESMIFTYPDYYGRCLDGESISRMVHEKGGFVLTDSAHGAHLPFSTYFPPDASKFADVWIQSAHKTLPALTQSAYLHASSKELGDMIRRAYTAISTTSPSYILLASLDHAREYMSTIGKDRLEKLYHLLATARMALRDMGYKVDFTGKEHGIYHDFSRLTIDVSPLGISGYSARDALELDGFFPEMADMRRVVLLTSVCDDSHTISSIVKAFSQLARNANKFPPIKDFGAPMPRPTPKYAPKEAFFGKIQLVPLKEAVGRTAAGVITVYPPGLAAYTYGEEISSEGVDYLTYISSNGGHISGLYSGKIPVLA